MRKFKYSVTRRTAAALIFICLLSCAGFSAAEDNGEKAVETDFANEILTVRGRGIVVAKVLKEDDTTLTIREGSGTAGIQKNDITHRQNVYKPEVIDPAKKRPEDILPPGAGASPLDFLKEAQRRALNGNKKPAGTPAMPQSSVTQLCPQITLSSVLNGAGRSSST